MSPSLTEQFESKLNELEIAARRGDSLQQLLQMAQTALDSLLGTNEIVVVVNEAKQGRLLAGTCSSEICEAAGDAVRSQEVTASPQIQQHSAKGWNVTVGRLISKEHACFCQFLLLRAPSERSLEINACETVADILAEATGRLLLSDLNQRLRQYGQISHFVHSLARTRGLFEWAQEVAQKSPEYLGKGRVTVLTRLNGDWTAIAATGTSVINQASEAIARNQKTASILTKSSLTGEWLDTNSAPEISDPWVSDARIIFAQYEALGIRQIRIETVSGNDGSLNHAVLVEVFGNEPLPPEPLVQLLRQEISEAVRLLPRETTRSSFAWPRNTLAGWLIAAALALLILSLIPAEFEIEVEGQAFPQERRQIFAPDQGLVEELFVSSDQRVKADDSLLRLRNPERDLDLNRVLGDIESAVSRLQAIRATRTSAASSNENNPASRAAELSSEELQLERRLETLREEQGLIEQQIAALMLRSPIDGVVYQSRLQEQLRSRPVQRGQQLLEIVNDSAEWQLNLQVPDSLVGYIPISDSETNLSTIKVQYVLMDDSRTIHEAGLKSLDLASYVVDGQLSCLATVEVNRSVAAALRPGQSVSARINCGKRSLAFVWFREVIEFWHRKKFAWL